ncbi:MAG: asparagine synthase (glutamine-hydrolyzing) [Planctomycetes bacterium]|jgi:asparagine synthase (glutamine-hydrolysing)|nr:asparagine synthase (glutamine-hydrolyzing) [Planctomycetota bacterium]
MCGIAGYVRGDPSAPPESDAVRRMAGALRHRGPDDAGLVEVGPAALGHRRLSILDLAGGKQPMFSEDGNTVLVHNGEIYNHVALRRELESRGHRFRTRSDTEVLLHCWLQWGEACLERLRGMFAFGIYDRSAGRLFLVRDRLGVKPLYYAERPDGIAFASSLLALVAGGAVAPRVDPVAVCDYLHLRYVPSPGCVFEGARKLPPATVLSWRAGHRTLRTWWEPPVHPDPEPPVREWRERLRVVLAEAVSLRATADVPVGAFLSGGVDSSSIVALMCRAAVAPIRTLTIGFPGTPADESRAAREVAGYFGTDHREIPLRQWDAQSVEDLAGCLDEPLGDSSAVPAFEAARRAREQVKVVLSGDGGDECFAGYRRYRHDLAEHRARCHFWGAARLAGEVLWRLAPASARIPRWLRGRTFLANSLSSPADAWFRSVGTEAGEDKWGLLRPEVRETLAGYDPGERFRRLAAAAPAPDPLSRALWVDLKTWLPDAMLVKADRTSMAAGLEVRSPFLDHMVVELAAAIPGRLKLAGGRGKAILRDAMRPLLPAAATERGKRGFAMPLDDWFRADLSSFGRDRILGANRRSAEWIDPAGAKRLLVEHERGRRNHGDLLWVLLAFSCWAERHAGGRVREIAR